jgi:hypothetical protein
MKTDPRTQELIQAGFTPEMLAGRTDAYLDAAVAQLHASARRDAQDVAQVVERVVQAPRPPVVTGARAAMIAANRKLLTTEELATLARETEK